MIIWLNGISSDAYSVTVSGVQRPLTPVRTAREVAVPGRPGTYVLGVPDVGKYDYKFVCHFEPMAGMTLLETAQAIALWLAAATTLIMDDQPTIQRFGNILAATDLDNMVALGKFSFTFSAQPYGEDTATTTAAINAVVDYGSQKPFAPVITINLTASAASLQVLLVSTGQLVRVTGTLASGDAIIFDMGRGLVTRNGTSIMSMVSLDSRFFLVPPGAQSIITTPSTGLTGQLTYKKRYP